MILKEKKFKDVVMGATKQMAFSIDTDSHVIFDILRNKMYKDKIGSICREVMSNSRDANRESGSTENIRVAIVDPEDIWMVTHQCISFEDNGIGITPDRMEDVFLKYGASTKRANNDQTGGFGLGAKTPFAYNDTFTIITTCDWEEPITEIVEYKDEETGEVTETENVIGHKPSVRYTFYYTALIDGTRRGKMALFHMEEADVPTGTKILVPLKTPEDRREFERKCWEMTKFWGNVDYNNFKWVDTKNPPEVLYQGDGFKVLCDVQDSTSLIIDGIPYPLDRNEKYRSLTIGRNYGFALEFKTGELTISANREAVQYDEDTVNLIAEKTEHIYEELKKMLVDYLNGMKTYLEACAFKAKFSESIFPNFEKNTMPHFLCSAVGFRQSYNRSVLSDFYYDEFQFLWRGKEVRTTVPVDHHNMVLVKDKEGFSSFSRSRIYNEYKTFPLSKIDGLRIYMLTEGVGRSSRRNETIFELDGSDFLLFSPKSTSSEKERKKELEKLKKLYGIKPLDYGKVELAPRRASTSSSKPSSQISVRKCKQYGWWEETETLYLNGTKDKLFWDKEMTNEVDLDNLCFKRVERITTRRYDNPYSKAIEISEDLKCYKVNYTAFDKKLSKVVGVKTLEQRYEEWKKKNERKWKNLAWVHLVHDAVTDVIPYYEDYKDILDPFLPPVVKAISYNPTRSKEYAEAWDKMRGEVKFNQDKLIQKIRRNMSPYPMILPYINNVRDTEAAKEVVQTYIKQVDNYDPTS